MPDYAYDEEIAARYDLAVPLQPGEVDFYLELARDAEAKGLRSLEVTCGTGRVAIPLARAGIRIVGLDNSVAMLARARENSAGLSNIEWVAADMRAFDLGEQFGLVYIPIGSFQLMLSIDDQLAALRCIHRHLAPEGCCAFEVENPSAVSIAEWLTAKLGAFVRQHDRDYVDPGTGRRVMSWISYEYHPAEQRYLTHRMREELDDAGAVVRRSYGRPMTVRYFYRYEMEHLLARAGFAVEALYGDFYRRPYTQDSPDFIWVARRAG